MSTLIADLETDNLYPAVSKLHCLAIVEEKGEDPKLYVENIKEGLLRLYYADRVVFHNGCGYDEPTIQKFYPKFRCNMWDTLIASKLRYPERRRHSIESWGEPWGLEKIQNEDWSVYTELMGERCLGDIQIGLRLYRHLIKAMEGADWERAMELEMEVARIHVRQVVAGVDVDTEHAMRVINKIDKELGVIDTELLSKIPKKCRQKGVTIGKPFLKRSGGYRKSVVDWFGEEL
jgi:hypothetical protein